MLLGIVQKINAYLSDYILVFLLIGVGLWYTVRTRFVQIRYFGAGMKQVFGNLKLRGDRHELLPGPGYRHCRTGGYG